jgi:hypothetical protein
MKLSPAKLVLAVAAALLAIAMVAPAAEAATPAPGYEQFTGCPSPAENSKVQACVHSVVTEGHFQMGSKDVPIEHPITLTGGTEEFLEGFVANSKGGLQPVKQKVPGGVIGLTGLTFLLEILGSEALTLYAVTELAGTPQLGFNNITLPIKVHLVNGVLGSKCYVGSSSNPISLHLTTGTTSPPAPNKPITGKSPEFGANEALEILLLKGGVYVDNSFAAPGASGCVLTLFGFIPISINGLVNAQSGLPSPAGTNETIQHVESEITPVFRVYP